MMGDFFKTMAVTTAKNLEKDNLLSLDENADQIGAMLIDSSMPEKMMDLEQKHRILSGDPLYYPSWSPESRAAKEVYY
jgi:hypothetical protein